MSLLSIDITKVGRLSLREVKLPTTERRVDPTLIQVERPLTAKETFYNKLITTYPLFKELVVTFDLIIE